MGPRVRGAPQPSKPRSLDDGTFLDSLVGPGQITLDIVLDGRRMQCHLLIADEKLLMQVDSLLGNSGGKPMSEVRAIEIV